MGELDGRGGSPSLLEVEGFDVGARRLLIRAAKKYVVVANVLVE